MGVIQLPLDIARLKALRLSYKKNQEDIALLLNITRAAYTNIELGKREPDLSTIGILADYFDVSTDFLLGRTNEKQPIKQVADKEIIENINNLSPEGREKAKEYIEMLKTLDEVKRQNITDIRKNG